MDDKELPGFKVNYNGGEGDEAGETMDSNAGDVSDGGRGDMLAENGPVAHGEGEIKPVMLENEHEGGPEEKTLKTAPEGVGGQFEGAEGVESAAKGVSGGSGGDGLDGFSAGASGDDGSDGSNAGASGENSKSDGPEIDVRAEASAISSANVKAKSRKGLVIGVVAGVVTLAVIGAGIWFVAGRGEEKVTEGLEISQKDGGEPEEKSEEDGEETEKPDEAKKPSDKAETSGVVKLSLDNETVKKIYGNFRGIASPFDGWWGFYVDDGVKNGELNREKMLLLAGANYPEGACTSYHEYGNGDVVANECVSGEAIRQKIREMFGQEIELAEGDKVGSFCGGKRYDVINDEFYQVGNSCGGWPLFLMECILERAELQGDKIYLYERVLVFEHGGRAYYSVGEKEILRETGEFGGMEAAGEKLGEYVVPEDVLNSGGEAYNAWLIENRANLAKEYGTQFKWAFRKNAEGNYVFEGLTRVK